MTAQLGASVLRADRVEYDIGFQSLFARGAVRLTRGSQHFQASALRYNLVSREGQLDDVYGVIDLAGEASEGRAGVVATDREPLVCPALLPANPDWHPQPWAVTAWGGQMIDAPFGDTFRSTGRCVRRPYWALACSDGSGAGPLALELEADLFSHIAQKQRGGEYKPAYTQCRFSGANLSGKGLWASGPACGFNRG